MGAMVLQANTSTQMSHVLEAYFFLQLSSLSTQQGGQTAAPFRLFLQASTSKQVDRYE